ncbi:MAG: GntR family transcriptional regulator [Firmicutes bacterium]|nr:GntR family transcriptional regulator [Bacillota bacterium]
MPWNFENDRPIYIQLVERIQLLIFSGTYPAGTKLPSVRDLANEAAVNPNTMQRALAKLEEDGLIITQRTSGRFVTEDEKMIKKARDKLVQEQINEFLVKIQDLGFGKEEVLAIITKMLEEMKI